MYLKHVPLFLSTITLISCARQNFQRFTSQSPDQLSKSLDLLQNPFLATSLVSGNQNDRSEPVNVPSENADVFNYLQKNQKPTTDDEELNVKELLQNDYFRTFFKEFSKQYKQINTEPSPAVTEAPAPAPAPIQRSRRPQTTAFPFFETTTPTVHTNKNVFVNFDTAPFVSKPTRTPHISRKNSRRPSIRTTTLPPLFNFEAITPKTTTLPPVFNFDDLTKQSRFNLEPEPTSPAQQPKILSRTHLKTVPTKKNPESEYDESVFRKQAESAKYMFASNVDDSINGNLHERQEVRDGVNVKGRYSYSDGFFKRTVHYEADDKGYRVVKEDVEPIGNGPEINPDGHAKVSSYVAGNAFNYEITKKDIQEKKKMSFEAFNDEDYEN